MIAPGNRMPFCAGMTADRQFYSFDVQAGRAAVLVLGGGLSAAALDPLIDTLAAHRPALMTLQADLVIMLGFAAGPFVWQSGPGAAYGVRIVLCQDDFFGWCGMPEDAPLLVVIDRAARVVASWATKDADPPALTEAVLNAVEHIGREAAQDCVLPAPVLSIPGLFDAVLCRELIERFETGAHFDSGVSSLGADGKPLDRLNHDKKRRRDWLLKPGDDIHDRVLDLLFQRCGPEIKRAFQCEVSHADRVLVARYDDSGGYFKRHRDNMGESVAFRQFALSVNLNAGYEGGDLLFPEHNDHRYRPAEGGGIVFSTSLLHEVNPVTSGRRFGIFTFLSNTGPAVQRAPGAGPQRKSSYG